MARASTAVAVGIPLGWLSLIALADQLSKWAALTRLRGSIPLWDDWVRLRLARNPGAAFGAFPEWGDALLWLTILVFVGLVVAIVRLGRRGASASLLFGLATVAGGALGNGIDRLRYGYVVDFLDVGISPTLRWPTFNLADTAIVLGTAVLLWHLLRGEGSRKGG